MSLISKYWKLRHAGYNHIKATNILVHSCDSRSGKAGHERREKLRKLINDIIYRGKRK